jgi:hypothetical protein
LKLFNSVAKNEQFPSAFSQDLVDPDQYGRYTFPETYSFYYLKNQIFVLQLLSTRAATPRFFQLKWTSFQTPEWARKLLQWGFPEVGGDGGRAQASQQIL